MITNNINYLGYMQPLGYMPFYIPNVLTPHNYKGIFQYNMNPQMLFLPYMNNIIYPNNLKNSSLPNRSVQSSKKGVSSIDNYVHNLNNNQINHIYKKNPNTKDKRAQSEEKNKLGKNIEIKIDNSNFNVKDNKRVKGVVIKDKIKTPSPKNKNLNILPHISNNNQNDKYGEKENRKKDIFSYRYKYDYQFTTNPESNIKKSKISYVK
jgi:hypothetical protein